MLALATILERFLLFDEFPIDSSRMSREIVSEYLLSIVVNFYPTSEIRILMACCYLV